MKILSSLSSKRLLSPVSCLLSPVSCLLSPVSCLLSPVSCLLRSDGFFTRIGLFLICLGAPAAQAGSSISNPLTGFTGHSQNNFPSQPATLNGSGLNVSFVWDGGEGAWERIAFSSSGAAFGGNSPTGTGGDLGRNYLRTNEVDFATQSFRAFVTVNRTARESVFFGMGTGALGAWKQPDVGTGNACVFVELQEGWDNASRRVIGGTSSAPTNNEVGYDGMTNVTGLMRIRMDYNAIAKTVSYAIDYNPSGSFVADQTFAPVDVSPIAAEWAGGEKSCIYFGGQRDTAFSDLVIDTSGLPFAGDPGRMTREVWYNIPGVALSNFTASSRYFQPADSITLVAGASVPENIGQNFASRVRGYITAPVAGAYTFWIASDDQSELRLSSSESKFGAAKIASLTTAVQPFAWDTTASQKSAIIQLVAGQKYFFEALQKQGEQADHLAIAWQTPGGSRELIPASALRSFTLDANDLDSDSLPDSWEITNGFSIAPYSATPSSQVPTADPDHDGYTHLEEATYGMDPNARGGLPGTLLLETWNNIPGSSVGTLTKNSRFTAPADQSEFISSAETPVDRADNYGVRMRGRLLAPTTGDYTFYVAGDDSCELWLSSSSSQFAKQKIASVNGWTGIREWNRFPTQISGPISLVAGQQYYLEALMKEALGEDHLEIGWKTPGSSTITIIPASVLESYAYDVEDPDGDNMPSSWETANGLNPALHDAALDPDTDIISNFLEYTASSNPQVPNRLSMELWTNIAEYSTRALVYNPKFYAPPQAVTSFSGSTTGEQTNPGINFATRTRGYLIAPVAGAYRFWISGRNGVELYLSTDPTKYAKRRIAEINPDSGGGHGVGSDSSSYWDQFSSQQSAEIYLEAGQDYFFEALQANGHVWQSHMSLAWAPPDGPRGPIPDSCMRSYVPEAADADDDYLPDEWETQYGLNPLDNGYTDLALQGERGDYDSDGVSNRDEYLLGTAPNNADTDGDGETDGAEVNALGSNALVENVITDTFLSAVSLANFTSSSTPWTMTSGGLLANDFRGEATWNFSVPSDGNWLVRLDLELMGSTYGNEEVPVAIKVDGKLVVRRQVRFGSGKFGLLQTLTPWLLAGNHQITVLVDNTLARRTVRLVAMKIYAPSNAAAALAAGNRVLSYPASSRTSPAFIEGYARDSGTVTVNGVPAQIGTGNGHWFANVPLANVEFTQPHTVQFEQGWQAPGTIAWQATNVMDGGSLVIRQGDALRLGAWGSDPAMTSTVTVSFAGTSALTGLQTIPLTFPTPGVFTVNATLQSGGSASLTVKVVGPPAFPGGMVDVLDSCVRTLAISASPEVVFDTQEDLCRLILSRTANTASVGIQPTRPEELGIAARLFMGGPILSIQRVNVIGVSDALQNDLTTTAAGNISGYKMYQSPLTALNLPPGARIDVSIFRAGVMFTNGTTLKSIYPADLTNGSVILQFLFPLGMSGGYCHNLLIYDRNGVYLGTR